MKMTLHLESDSDGQKFCFRGTLARSNSLRLLQLAKEAASLFDSEYPLALYNPSLAIWQLERIARHWLRVNK